MIWLALYFGLWTVALRVKRVPLTRFDFVVTATWLASVLLALVPLVEYERGVSDLAVVLVLLSHLGLLVGFYALHGGRSRRVELDVSAVSISRLLPALAIVFAVGSFGRALSQGRVPVVETFGRLEATRRAYLESGLTNRVDAVITVLQYVAIVFVVLAPFYWQRGDRRRVALAGVTFFGIVETSFATGGRASIVFALVGVAATFLICYRPKIRHHIGLVTVAAVVVVVLGSVFVTTRNRDFAANPRIYVAYNCVDAEFGGLVSDASSTSLKALASASCYFSSPIYALDMVISDEDFDVGQRMGAYTLGRVFQSEFAEARAEIADYFRVRGLAQNGWATSVRDMWLDLRSLAPVGFVILGGVVAVLTNKRRVSSEFELARLALMAPFGFMIPFMSPLVIPALVYPIAATLLLGAIPRLRLVPSSSRRTRSGARYSLSRS